MDTFACFSESKRNPELHEVDKEAARGFGGFLKKLKHPSQVTPTDEPKALTESGSKDKSEMEMKRRKVQISR